MLTILGALQTFVYFMIRHPQSWQRAKDEITAAQGKGRCHGRVVSYEDATRLPYSEACIYEATRMFGPGPFGFPRVAPKGGITIGTRHFPEGTTLSINPQSVKIFTA